MQGARYKVYGVGYKSSGRSNGLYNGPQWAYGKVGQCQLVDIVSL